MNTHIYFIFAHLDDETILSYGTIKKYLEQQNAIITIICFCSKGRQLSKVQNSRRLFAFKKIFNELNVQIMLLPYHDLCLTKLIIQQNLNKIKINKNDKNIIFTHSCHDLHFEHRLLAEEILVKFRPFSNINSIYTCVSPTYNWTNNEFGNFTPNYFVDISKFIEDKKNALRLYDMELCEDNNDNRSVQSILNSNRQYGFQMNTKFCEAYQLLWSKN